MLAAVSLHAQEDRKSVLVVLQTSGENFGNLILDSISATLNQGGNIDLFIETFDFNRFQEARDETNLARYLTDKYLGLPIDLVIPIGPGSLRLFAAEHESLFPETPLVFTAVSDWSMGGIDNPSGATGVLGNFDIIRTLDLARALQPDAKRLVIVNGSAPIDLSWNARARSQLAGTDDIEVSFLSGLTVADIEGALAGLPTNCIVILLTVFEDGAGERFSSLLPLVARFSEASAAPVYGVYETWLGNGIVGGYVDTIDALGKQTAEAALRILGGESASSIPIRYGEANFVIDQRVLDRWDLNEARLPAGTRVSFYEPSVWDRYRDQLLAVVALLVAQTLLIVLLLLRARKQRVERELRRVEDRYRTIVQEQTDLICRYLPDTTLTFVNDAFCQFFRRDQEDLIGTTLAGLIPEPLRDNMLRRMESLVSHPRNESYELRFPQHESDVVYQLWTDHAIVDRKGKVVEIQSIGRDISQRRRAELEAREQREQVAHLTRVAILGELAGALAHELNQPLTAILSNAQSASMLLEKKSPDIAKLREILTDIEADDKRAGDIIWRLRTMLRKGAAKLETVQVHEVVEQALVLCHAQLIEHYIRVRMNLADDLPNVQADHVQLLQVVLNLIMNASDAMSQVALDQREILISASYCHDTARVMLLVADSGPRLNPDTIEHMIEPFFTTKESGLGLGLTICQSIVTAHGGQLSVRANPDRGVTVSVSLPSHTARAARGPANQAV